MHAGFVSPGLSISYVAVECRHQIAFADFFLEVNSCKVYIEGGNAKAFFMYVFPFNFFAL